MNVFIDLFPIEMFIVFDPLSLILFVAGVHTVWKWIDKLVRKGQKPIPRVDPEEYVVPRENDLFASVVDKRDTVQEEVVRQIAAGYSSTPPQGWQDHLKDLRSPGYQKASSHPLNTVWDKSTK